MRSSCPSPRRPLAWPLALLLAAAPPLAAAGPPLRVNYQGKLTDKATRAPKSGNESSYPVCGSSPRASDAVSSRSR